MQNGPRNMRNTRQPRPPTDFAARQKRWTSGGARPSSNGSHDARRNYERYIALAQAQIQCGDIVAAENYFQHAEHYFRTMSSDRGDT
jgi:hypothetical protein